MVVQVLISFFFFYLLTKKKLQILVILTIKNNIYLYGQKQTKFVKEKKSKKNKQTELKGKRRKPDKCYFCKKKLNKKTSYKTRW